MLVPFVYSTNDFTLDVPGHTWVFHKYAYFAYQNNFPIIASDIYFKDYENSLSDYFYNNFMFKKAPDTYLEKMQKYAIKNLEIQKKINKNNTLEITCNSLTKIDKELENKLSKILEQIKKDYPKEKITILTWLDNATLRKVAADMHIKIIYQELSTIRLDQYNSTLCYCSFNSKYNDCQKENYDNFLKISKKVKIFSKEEILALFLRDDYLMYLKEMKKAPKYKVGFSPGINVDWFFKLYSSENQSKTLEKIKNMFPESAISYRFHPSHEMDLDFGNCHRDANQFSYSWILDNDAIVTSVSNIGFEAMLFGKKSIVLTDAMPWSFAACNNIEDLKYFQEGIAPDSFISYMIFGYFVPLELAFDKDYLEWRLTNPSLKEIYNRNLEFILKKKKLKLQESTSLYDILTKYRKLSSQEALDIINYNYYNEINIQKEKIEYLNNVVDTKNNQIDNLETTIKNLELELSKMLNSKSWKITKPLRAISNFTKKK